MDQSDAGIKRYLHLARVSWEVLRLYGIRGILLTLVRCFKKVKSENLEDSPRAQDYIKGLVTVAILSKNRLDLIQPCLEAIHRFLSNKYKIEILIGDTGTTEPEVWQYYREAADYYKNIEIIKFDSYYFSKNYNQLIESHARGQYVILLNNDTMVTDNWLDNLIDPLADAQIGIVGAKLLYPDDTIQHAGIEFNEQGRAFHIYAKQPRDFPEADYKALVPGVTFAGAAMRHKVFDRFQLDENYKEEHQDTDFCLRLTEAGFKVLYNPAAVIYHFEYSSRDWRRGRLDILRLRKLWASKIKSIWAQKRQRLAYDA
jgi:GT2 family glycosyltransferase